MVYFINLSVTQIQYQGKQEKNKELWLPFFTLLGLLNSAPMLRCRQGLPSLSALQENSAVSGPGISFVKQHRKTVILFEVDYLSSA